MRFLKGHPKPQIGKRATFIRNLLLITKQKNIQKALKGWSVVRLVDISRKNNWASCELCGTHFKHGALMKYDPKNIEITVGGNCVETLHGAGFSAGARRQRLKNTKQIFDKNYGKSILWGAWLTWIIENTPRRLASAVLDLKLFGATRTDEEMHQLIDYHDGHRLYPVEALIDEWRLLFKVGIKVPEYLTLKQARRFLASSAVLNNKAFMKARADRFRQKKVLPFVKDDVDKKIAWDNLCRNDKRIVTSIAYLSENRLNNATKTLKDLYDSFAPADFVSSIPLFVWSPTVGLGFWGKDKNIGNDRIRIERWSDQCMALYDLHYFRSVHSDNATVVSKIELLAFGK